MDLQNRYKQSRSQLKQALTSSNGTSDELVENLRSHVEALQQRLDSANEENDQMRKRNLSEEQQTKAELQELEQQFIDLQVATSRERAAMARQREQLERLKDELEHKLNSKADGDDANSKIRAMRQHLSEIHEQEKGEQKRLSLSGRISNLLGRTGR